MLFESFLALVVVSLTVISIRWTRELPAAGQLTLSLVGIVVLLVLLFVDYDPEDKHRWLLMATVVAVTLKDRISAVIAARKDD